MKKLMRAIVCVLVLVMLVGSTGCAAPAQTSTKVKNVILMIGDGVSIGISTLARWSMAQNSTGGFDTNVQLNMDPYASGLIRTYWENLQGEIGATTDSAPGATAYAIGEKTENKYIGVDRQGKTQATVLELAQSMGKSTGLVSTVYTQHATPAAFAAHTTDREDYQGIAAQMLDCGVDVVLGGGAKYMQNREDGRDLIAELKAAGYSYLTTGQELSAYTGNKVYGMFAPGFMAYDIDRSLLAPEEPTLREMTEKAIDILSQNEKGFFLMVEASKVDWGAHNNDPAAVVSEFLAFDKAVGTAMEFAKERDDTMVLVVEDHGTGGMTIGDITTSASYDTFMLKDVIGPLSQAKITGDGAIALLKQGKSHEAVLQLYGITEPTPEELAWVEAMEPDVGKSTSENRFTLGGMLSSRCKIGWTTRGHTGEDVVLYSYLPGDERITGAVENTDITLAITNAWGKQLDKSQCTHNTAQ